jgi:hypothetical protein
LNTLPMWRAAAALLAAAFSTGLVMAFYRFGSDHESPPWLAKLHGYAAIAALALLLFSWTRTDPSRAGIFGILALVLAAVGGVVLNLTFHWRHKPLPEGLVFAHMSVAFIGFLVVSVSLLGGGPPPGP